VNIPVEHARSGNLYTQLASLFDLVAGARGELNLIELLRVMQKCSWPDWLLLWQKSTGALVNSLSHLKAADLIDLTQKVKDTLSILQTVHEMNS